MSFRSLELQQIYDSAEIDIFKTLFVPLLSNAKSYKRGVGYFTSSWINLCMEGLIDLANREGTITLVTSPHLEEDDWEAFKLGDIAKRNKTLHSVLSKQVLEMPKKLGTTKMTLLAWLVADGILTVKIAIPRNGKGDFHDKYAIFEDYEGNKVALHGSLNDSQKASDNGEGVSVFCSWISGQEGFVSGHEQRFDRVFLNTTNFYDVFDLPQAIKQHIVKMRTRPRPYNPPVHVLNLPVKIPTGLTLYQFQQQAITEWFGNEGCGLFEMATGTGKTITALFAAVEKIRMSSPLLVLIAVPFDHLVQQWSREAKDFGFNPVLCHGNMSSWMPKVRLLMKDYSKGLRQVVCLITTYKTGSGEPFLSLFDGLDFPVLFIADESHYLGSRIYSRMLKPQFQYRIGLSATPDRWFDDEGSNRIREYFGKTVARIELKEAIERGFLTPYRFYPQTIQLTEEEYEQYADLSKKISQLGNNKSLSKSEREDRLQTYLIKRSRIIANAESKIPSFERLFKRQMEQDGKKDLKHTLVYCAPGETGRIVRLLASYGIRAREFIYTVDGRERQEVLRQFETGDIQVLVAIKCLDEGVNVPQTRTAYFLSSTTNPREFIQRRGRILRCADEKEDAVLYDFIACPPDGHSAEDAAISLLKREMPRFAEFADGCVNEFEARQVVVPLLQEHNQLYLIDIRPWDAYRKYSDEKGRMQDE